jgi:hypothetical protein
MKSTKQEYLTELRKILYFQKIGNPVEIDSVPELFRNDLFRYIAGETLQSVNGKVVIGAKRYRDWVKKVMSVGLDYVIQLENS